MDNSDYYNAKYELTIEADSLPDIQNLSILSKDCMVNLPNVTRFEVIDHTDKDLGPGRVYYQTMPKGKCRFSLQDDGRTLKVFLEQ